MALSVGSRLPGITWHFALWSPDFPPPPNFHRGQRLSDRLSAAKVNGSAPEEQALKALGKRFTSASLAFLFFQRDLIQHVLALPRDLRREGSSALEGHFLEQQVQDAHRLAADSVFTFRRCPSGH